MINCIAVDDEQAALDILVDYISETPFLNLVAATTNPMDAVGILQAQDIDLVFTDIKMPRINGLNLAQLFDRRVKFVMTTGYQDYALKGFELGVLDYLVKPFSYDRFLMAVNKMPLQMTLIDEPVAVSTPHDEYCFVKADGKGKFQKILFKDLRYVEAQKNYVALHLQEEQVSTHLSISDLEKRLPAEKFMRVHRSYIVAFDKITGIEGEQIIIDKTTKIPIGDSYAEAFFAIVQDKTLSKEREK